MAILYRGYGLACHLGLRGHPPIYTRLGRQELRSKLNVVLARHAMSLGFLFTPHIFSGSLARPFLRGITFMGVFTFESHRRKAEKPLNLLQQANNLECLCRHASACEGHPCRE